MYTEYTKNGKNRLAKNKRRIVVEEESIKGSTDYFRTLALTLLCQGGICFEKCSSLKFKSKCSKSLTSLRTNLSLSVDQIEPDWLAPEPFQLK